MKRPRSFNFLTLARTVSLIFRPSYYPTVAFAVLLTVTYLSLLPWSFKLWLLAVVYLFTVLIPWVGVMLYRKAHGWSTAELSRRHRRFVPYLLHIVSYLCCFSIIENVHMPAFAGALIVASLMLQCGCTIINIWWKISMHSAAAGAAVGALVAYSLAFGLCDVLAHGAASAHAGASALRFRLWHPLRLRRHHSFVTQVSIHRSA